MVFFSMLLELPQWLWVCFFQALSRETKNLNKKTNGWPGRSTKYTEVWKANVAPRHEAIYCVLSTKPGHEL